MQTRSSNPQEVSMTSNNLPAIKCIGHRGAMGYAPENTLASFQLALEMGAHCIELDVYAVDGELVVFHDDTLERTTNGTGTVMGQTFTALRQLDAGSGERIPTLDEVIRLVDKQAGINIELKGPNTADPVMETITRMRSAGWSDELILVSSFDHAQLARARELDPGVRLGALYFESPAKGLVDVRAMGAYALHPGAWFVDESLVAEAQAAGLKVYVYTVNEPAEIERMRQLGVDGVFTNYPDRVLKTQDNRDIPYSWV
jgi:glycerophosphoryl diester phosphodiesterase